MSCDYRFHLELDYLHRTSRSFTGSELDSSKQVLPRETRVLCLFSHGEIGICNVEAELFCFLFKVFVTDSVFVCQARWSQRCFCAYREVLSTEFHQEVHPRSEEVGVEREGAINFPLPVAECIESIGSHVPVVKAGEELATFGWQCLV